MNWYHRWQALWDPDRYHGWGKDNNYFEGWYFKVVSTKEDHVLAFIPGISKPKSGTPHAFIQILDGINRKATYHRFETSEFIPRSDRFFLQLGNNQFSAQEIKIDLPGLKGILQFTGNVPWPKMLYAPGIMGWFSFVPFMECYHGVVSVDHQIKGILQVNNKEVDFTGGRGYIEKDWGQSFPNAWIWTQTNHFEEHGVSLMASVANIPWLNSYFIGYIVGFLWEGKIYRFATYTGAQMKARLGAEEVYLAFRDRNTELQITAHKSEGSELLSPISGEMTGKVNESMQATVQVKFYKKGQLCFEGTGKHAGLELAGKVEKLLTDSWRR